MEGGVGHWSGLPGRQWRPHPWGHLRHVQMWQCRTWLSGGGQKARQMVGLGGFVVLFQPRRGATSTLAWPERRGRRAPAARTATGTLAFLPNISVPGKTQTTLRSGTTRTKPSENKRPLPPHFPLHLRRVSAAEPPASRVCAAAAAAGPAPAEDRMNTSEGRGAPSCHRTPPAHPHLAARPAPGPAPPPPTSRRRRTDGQGHGPEAEELAATELPPGAGSARGLLGGASGWRPEVASAWRRLAQGEGRGGAAGAPRGGEGEGGGRLRGGGMKGGAAGGCRAGRSGAGACCAALRGGEGGGARVRSAAAPRSLPGGRPVRCVPISFPRIGLSVCFLRRLL